MKTLYGILICTVFLFCGSSLTLAESEPAGIVKAVSGEVFIVNGETAIQAVANMRLRQGDTVKTGTNSSAGLIFEDDTVVALGSNSEMSIDKFLFNPADKELSFIARLIRGTFSFITGQIAKLAPKQVSLETPDATLGVRGTKFLVKID